MLHTTTENWVRPEIIEEGLSRFKKTLRRLKYQEAMYSCSSYYNHLSEDEVSEMKDIFWEKFSTLMTRDQGNEEDRDQAETGIELNLISAPSLGKHHWDTLISKATAIRKISCIEALRNFPVSSMEVLKKATHLKSLNLVVQIPTLMMISLDELKDLMEARHNNNKGLDGGHDFELTTVQNPWSKQSQNPAHKAQLAELHRKYSKLRIEY